jgi:hypothetical protein
MSLGAAAESVFEYALKQAEPALKDAKQSVTDFFNDHVLANYMQGLSDFKKDVLHINSPRGQKRKHDGGGAANEPKVTVLPKEDSGDSSVGKLPSTTKTVHRSFSNHAMGSDGSSSTVTEVPVIDPPKRISKSHPDYFTINLPFYKSYVLTTGPGEQMDTVYIRLNTPYDPMYTGISESRQPLGRDTWATIYDFYRVLSSDVNMTFTYVEGAFGDDQTTTPRNWDGDTPVHALVGYQVTDDSADSAATTIAFVEQKHSKAVPLHPTNINALNMTAPDATNASVTRRLMCHGGSTGMSFHYQPENWDYHVTQLGQEERWTHKEQTPDYNHYLGITQAYPNDNNNLGTNEHIKIQVDLYITYTVQWREVNSTYKRTIDTS